ncbi:MAG: C4-dicarboxylate ABC transporter [Candidatus Binatota bacterium]|nr:C4-dicarboxylate ABC transporter [Candidatus Binatota bacterium]
MRMPHRVAAISLPLLLLPYSSQAQTARPESEAQAIVVAQNAGRPSAVAEGESENVSRVNAWTVGVVGGLLEGSFLRFAAELGKVLDDGENLRVLPIVSYGAVENVNDLLYLKGVDIAITNADVFSEFRRTKKPANIEKRINYISSMFVSEVHVFARPEIKSLQDLEGKTVSLGKKGAGQTITGPIIFERLGIKVNLAFVEAEASLEKMKTGEIAAIVQNGGKPNPLFAKLKPEPGFHFLSVPYDEKFFDYYVPSTLNKDDYPALVGEGETIETLGVPAVLAVYNWPRGSDRFRKVERFVQYYFDRFENLRKPPYHPKWKEINLAAKVPGWSRYFVAEEMLGKTVSKAPRGIGAPTASALGVADGRGGVAEQDKVFQEFLEWKKKNGR